LERFIVVEENNPLTEKYSEIEKLQIAFLKTFPKNICMVADTKQKYPYYLMVSNQELMKVHGSSVTNILHSRPAWICCQNIVISSITQREMTRLVVPIKPEYFDELKMVETRKAINISKNCVTRVEEFSQVPTSLMSFYRRRNRIELFQKLFKENDIYLETEEDIEKVLYFYLEKTKGASNKREKIREINQQIEQYAKDMIKKRHALIKVSERTKFQVDENCQIIDVLNNSEYLGILIKSVTKDTMSTIEKIRKDLQVKEEHINIEVNRDGDVTFLYLMNKKISAEFFKKLSLILSNKLPAVPCYELKGGNEDFGGKFKKWKFILNWYEGIPNPEVNIKIFHRAHFKNLKDLLDKVNEKVSKERLERQDEQEEDMRGDNSAKLFE
jgi:hypothetical protein